MELAAKKHKKEPSGRHDDSTDSFVSFVFFCGYFMVFCLFCLVHNVSRSVVRAARIDGPISSSTASGLLSGLGGSTHDGGTLVQQLTNAAVIGIAPTNGLPGVNANVSFPEGVRNWPGYANSVRRPVGNASCI
jgi:hypothetical protein